MLAWADYEPLDDITTVSSPDFTEQERSMILSALSILEQRTFWLDVDDDAEWDVLEAVLATIAGKIAP